MNKFAVTRILMPLFMITVTAWGQRDLSTVTGTVTDPTGAVVAGAKITITEGATGLAYVVTASTDGVYVRSALKPGTYTVAADAPGFKRAIQNDVLLTAGDRVGVNITLQVGEASEHVEVSAAAALLQTENTAIGTDLSSRSVEDLPLGGQRRVAFLARLSVGVLVGEASAFDSLGGSFTASGVHSTGQNNYLLNGMDNNANNIDYLGGQAYVISVPPEAVGEMRIMTNGYNAEYGRGSGGVVDITLKSGTNHLNGALYEFLQNDKLNANRWEANKAGFSKGEWRQNQFGATVGGPIIKNRTFWFADYSGLQFVSNTIGGGISQGGGSPPSVFTIPTAAMTQGNFSSELGTGQQGMIFNPTSTQPNPNGTGFVRTPFPGNIIPLSAMDPAAMKILSLMPAPDQNFSARVPGSNFVAPALTQEQLNQGDLRIDHKITDKDSLFGSLSWGNSFIDAHPFVTQADGGALVEGRTQSELRRLGMLSYTRIWSPTILTETRASYNRLVVQQEPSDVGIDSYKLFGIAGFDPFSTAAGGGLPSFSIQGYSSIGGGRFLPTLEYSNVWDYMQNVSINRDKHAFKFGTEYRVVRLPMYQPDYPHGGMTFTNNLSNNPQPAFAGQTGDGMASFLLGYPSAINLSTNNWTEQQHSAWAFYGQDDWKITPKLTFNLGLRYELFAPWTDGANQQANLVLGSNGVWQYDIAPGKNQNLPLSADAAAYFAAAGVQVNVGQPSKYLIPWDKFDFGPRTGFAYQIQAKTVIRAGYGIFYGGEENRGGFLPLDENPPFNEDVGYTGPTYTTGGAAPTSPYVNRLSSGFPTNFFNLVIPQSLSIHGEAADLLNPMVQKWNFAIQRELPFGNALEVSYLGNHQSHLWTVWDPNAAPNSPNVLISSTILNNLRPNPALGTNANYLDSFAFGNYDALGVKLEKRYSKGLQYTATYTWSHALASTSPWVIGLGGQASPNPENMSLVYSSAAWDIRHNFVASVTYELPVGKGKMLGSNWNPVLQRTLGNWQVNGLLTLHTGQPFTLASLNGIGYLGYQRDGSYIYPSVLPGQNPNAAPPGGRTPSEWFNTSNIVATAPYTEGNLGNATNIGPPARNLDFSLFKEIPITERYKLTIRGEVFNLLNTPQFSVQTIGLTQGSGSFGQIANTVAQSERRIQIGMKFVF
jgi:hypothetical protein